MAGRAAAEATPQVPRARAAAGGRRSNEARVDRGPGAEAAVLPASPPQVSRPAPFRRASTPVRGPAARRWARAAVWQNPARPGPLPAVHDFPPWSWNIPERFNIGVACTDAHLGTPVEERTAVVVDDDRTGARQTTFAELVRQTSRFAQLLRDLGVGAGERVLIRLPNCLEYPAVFLGALKRGAIPVPTSG